MDKVNVFKAFRIYNVKNLFFIYRMCNFSNKKDHADELHEILENSIIKNRIRLIDHPLDTSRERERIRRIERLQGMCNAGDIFEVVVSMFALKPEKRTTPFGNEWVHLKMHCGVHQEAIVIPDIIDGVRALCYDISGKSKEESIGITDKHLGICD